MSDAIKHECGIVFLRLLKPLEFYLAKYGSSAYGPDKMYLLMEKQHNRGQDGAGIACVKYDLPPGHEYINRARYNTSTPIIDAFKEVFQPLKELKKQQSSKIYDTDYLKANVPFFGELYLGHLRYGTFGKNNIELVHPQIRYNNWKTRNLVLAGNFNLTNVDELFRKLISYGQHPVETSDTVTILEKIGNFLDEENNELYQKFKALGYNKKDISLRIAEELDVLRIIQRSAKHWDGGYAMAGLFGHGDGFVMRDPAGIRPAYYYYDDEIVVATSERPVIQTAFNVSIDAIKEIPPAHALIVKRNGSISVDQFTEPIKRNSCSFERIYFSRGTDADIYKERKQLGHHICPAVLKSINFDLENTVFSFIPNTAIVAFMGLREALVKFSNTVKKEKILLAGANLSPEELENILHFYPRAETIAVKDMKHRTFITQDKDRDDLVTHIYDVTYGVINPGVDNLVVVDDSIVRGTTLKQSIIKILDRLGPKKIVIASSAPQIRYPDCYGIDMAKLSDFIAFRATIELLRETHQESIIDEVYAKCKKQEHLPMQELVNYVKDIYRPFSAEQISEKIARMVTPTDAKAEVIVIFQTLEDLHKAIPGQYGDWYFSGNYPTPGGNRVVNKSFINYIEGRNERAY